MHHLKGIMVKSYTPTVILMCLLIALAASSTLHLPFHSGIICLFFGLISLAWLVSINRKAENRLLHVIKEMDWETAFFIIAVFMLVSVLSATGLIADIASFITGIAGPSLVANFLIIVCVSLLLSSFIDNVPYIVAMLPVTQIIAEHVQASPFLLYAGLLIGTSVGGNITPIGASANIVGVGLLKKRGYATSFWEFMRIGLPFSIVAVSVSCAFMWLIFGT